jgi:hypothetical protein
MEVDRLFVAVEMFVGVAVIGHYLVGVIVPRRSIVVIVGVVIVGDVIVGDVIVAALFEPQN